MSDWQGVETRLLPSDMEDGCFSISCDVQCKCDTVMPWA